MLSFISKIFSFNIFSSTRPTNDLIERLESLPIASCVLGISRIGKASPISNNIVHASLLLLNKEIDYDQDDEVDNNINGILIEYGNYSPNMSETEKDSTKKGLVVYRYGEKGGLRYYVKKYSEFIKQFADIGYIHLNINRDNQKDFVYFLANIAKKEDNKWIQSNYSVGLSNFNSHTFVIEALKELKPFFIYENIFPCNSDLVRSKNAKKKLEFVPQNIMTELMKYYRKL